MKNLIHHCLEGGGTVCKTKVHHQRLEETAVSTKGGLPFIALLNAHVVVSPSDVQLREVLRSFEAVD
jgi:hypothetical protein